MSGTAKWTAYTPITLIASVGNVADLGWANSGATLITNATERLLYMDAELVLAADVTTGAGARWVDVYLVPAPDGVNVASPPGTLPGLTPPGYLAGAITANPSSVFRRGTARGLILPPGSYLASIQNRLGVSFGAGAHVLTGYTYSEGAG
jgi:hypothetical protein